MLSLSWIIQGFHLFHHSFTKTDLPKILKLTLDQYLKRTKKLYQILQVKPTIHQMMIFPRRKKTRKNLIEANLMDTIRSVFACKRNMVPSIYENLDTTYKNSLKKAVFYWKGAKQMLFLSMHKIICSYYKITLQSLVFEKIAIF